MLKIRRSPDRLIFNIGIPIPGKDGLYIETEPRLVKGPLADPYPGLLPHTLQWDLTLQGTGESKIKESLCSTYAWWPDVTRAEQLTWWRKLCRQQTEGRWGVRDSAHSIYDRTSYPYRQSPHKSSITSLPQLSRDGWPVHSTIPAASWRETLHNNLRTI